MDDKAERVASTARTGMPGSAEDSEAPGLSQLLAGLTAVRDGDFGTRLPEDGDGLMDEIADRVQRHGRPARPCSPPR